MATTKQTGWMRLRDGYVFLRNNKPTGVKVVRADDPDYQEQKHKFEVASPEFLASLKKGPAPSMTTTEFFGLPRMKREDLLALHKRALGKDAPEDITVTQLRDRLRARYEEIRAESEAAAETESGVKPEGEITED